MSQSNYKEELREVLLRLRYGLNSEINKDVADALAAIDRLNASTIGEESKPQESWHDEELHRNQLRSELRQKFGVSQTTADAKKEDK